MKASEVENLICQVRDTRAASLLFQRIVAVRIEPLDAENSDIFYHYPPELVTEPAEIQRLLAPHKVHIEQELAIATAALAKLGIEVDERQALPDIIDEDYENAA